VPEILIDGGQGPFHVLGRVEIALAVHEH
jgi:hypothetical protein